MKKKIVSMFTLYAIAILLASAVFAQEKALSASQVGLEHFSKLANTDKYKTSVLSQFTPVRITLNNRDSYDFSDGLRGELTGGDFYLSGLVRSTIGETKKLS